MSILNYTKDGKIFWKAYVNVRSKIDPTIRAQKVVIGLKTEKAAQTEEKKLLKALSTKVAQKEGFGTTWKYVVDRWEEQIVSNGYQTLSESSLKDGMSTLRKWTDNWMRRSAGKITRVDAREVFKKLEEEDKSKGHQQRIKHFINTIFIWGMEEKLIRGNVEAPAKHILIKKKKAEKLKEVFTVEQIRILLHAAQEFEHSWYPIWLTALLTGMRNGELHALSWGDVDFEKRLITVSKSYNTKTRSVKCTKSGAWRNVPINDELYELLRALKLQSNGCEYILPRSWEWDKGEQARILRTFCKSIGLPSIRFHSLRACFATQLLNNDIVPARVMKICGWKDLKTMQHYVRLAGIDEQGATDCLSFLKKTDEEVMMLANEFSKQKASAF